MADVKFRQSVENATAHTWEHLCPVLPYAQGLRDLCMEDMIGEGRFGSVWRCSHRATGAQYACKQVPKAQHAPGSSLRREAQCLAQVQGHPNVLALEGVLESQDSLFLVTELCSGGDLYDLLGCRGRVEEEEARGLFRQLAEAVQHCHSRGIIHRDIKPENVLVYTCPTTGQTTLKLADFGLAQNLAEGEKAVGWVGSQPYEAPEVIACRPYDGKADVFSLGVLLFSLLSGAWPNFLEGKVFDAESDFSWPGWRRVSVEARSLIRSMLLTDQDSRPTAAEVLESPWLAPLGTEYCQLEPALEHVVPAGAKRTEEETLLFDMLPSWEPLLQSEAVCPRDNGAMGSIDPCWEFGADSDDLGLASAENCVDLPWLASQFLSHSSCGTGDAGVFYATLQALRSCSFSS